MMAALYRETVLSPIEKTPKSIASIKIMKIKNPPKNMIS
jgi:hypothetical protein